MSALKYKAKEIKFSIPYNGDIELVKWAIASGQVYEVYFAGSRGNDFSDGYHELRPHKEKEILNLLKICNKKKIRANLLLNKGILYFDDVRRIIGYIKFLKNNGGINSVTITDPFIILYIKNECPDIKLQSSVYMGINSLLKAKEAIKMGITELCLDPFINRDAFELKRIMQLKTIYPDISIKLLGMHACYLNCFFAWKHCQLSVLKNILENPAFKNKRYSLGNMISNDKCNYKIEDIADEIKRPVIRPEDIAYYENNKLTDYIKIAFRNDDAALLKQKFTAYFARSYKGNLFYLFCSSRHKKIFCDNKSIPDDFIEKVMNCSKDCSKCKYCYIFARKYMVVLNPNNFLINDLPV